MTLAAVVHGPAGVHFIAVCADSETLWRRLGSYVRQWAPYQLGEIELEAVVSALERGDLEMAVRAYFQHAGRWEPEALAIEQLDSNDVFHAPGLPGTPEPPDAHR